MLKLLFDCHCQIFICVGIIAGSSISQPNYYILQQNILSFAFVPREQSAEWNFLWCDERKLKVHFNCVIPVELNESEKDQPRTNTIVLSQVLAL